MKVSTARFLPERKATFQITQKSLPPPAPNISSSQEVTTEVLLPPRPQKSSPQTPEGTDPYTACNNIKSNALSTSKDEKVSLQSRIGKKDDEAMLGKLSTRRDLIQHFIPHPQEAPPNIYGKCSQSNSN